MILGSSVLEVQLTIEDLAEWSAERGVDLKERLLHELDRWAEALCEPTHGWPLERGSFTCEYRSRMLCELREVIAAGDGDVIARIHALARSLVDHASRWPTRGRQGEHDLARQQEDILRRLYSRGHRLTIPPVGYDD